MKANTHFLRSFITKTILTLLAGMMITSCVLDEMDNCPPPFNVRLVVQTDADAHGLQVSPTFDRYNIDSVLVYVFDADGQYVTAWSGGIYPEGEGYVIPLRLEPGDYQFVAVTNQGGLCDMNYSTEDLEALRPNLEDLRMQLNLPGDATIRTDIPDLHLGATTETVSEDRVQNDFTLIVRPRTFKVNFRVIGLPEGEEYTIQVTDKNFQRALEHLNSENEIAQLSNNFAYQRIETAEFAGTSPYSTFKTSMTLYDLMNSKEMPFHIYNSASEEVYSDDLIDMIIDAYMSNGRTVDFDSVYEFDIVITFAANLVVSVSVNGWTYTPQETDL